MKTIDEMIAVMAAFKDGKKIEDKPSYNTDGWALAQKPLWDWMHSDYRIRPEPEYRPYKNAEEAIKDVVKHGGWVKNTAGQYLHIIAVGENSMAYANNISFPYAGACNYWVWADDGTPCGVLEKG